MTFCGNCGNALLENQAVCASCGAGAASAAVAAPGSGLSSNVAALLTYVPCIVMGVIFLVLEPYKRDRFVRFHAYQSIFFGLAWIVFWVAWDALQSLLAMASAGMLALITLPISLLISLGGLVLWIVVLYKAYNHQEYRIPFIGALAAKQAGS